MPRTLKQAAQTALDVQDACNLSGVVQAFRDILMDTLWPIAHENHHGTDWVNQHPISVMFCDKISALTRHQFREIEAFSQAYDACTTLAATPEPITPRAERGLHAREVA